jgi:NodT family efflux transporter outer membrane factor (OMF) lipoprotein
LYKNLAKRKLVMTSMLKIFVALLAGLFFSTTFSGCAVGPDYVAPNIELVPFHNKVEVVDKEMAVSPSLDRWWMGFNDSELLKVVQRVLDQNLFLDVTKARVIQARAISDGSSAKLLPTIEFNGSVTRQTLSKEGLFGSIARNSPNFSRDFTNFTIGPAASWEIDFFGGLQRGEAASKAEFQASEADQAGARILVVADAADAYFQIRGYQVRLNIAEQQIKDDEHLLSLVHDRHTAGSATGREVAQAEALLKQARASVPLLRIGLEQQMNRLDVLMGVQPGTYMRELHPVTEIVFLPTIPGDQRPVDVLRRRPDVIAAERHLAASNERIGQAISEYYPKISLSGLLGFDSISSANLFTGGAFQAIARGTLRWRLFDFGKIDAEVMRTKGANAEALTVYRQAILRAAEDVENSLVVFAQTRIHIDEQEGEVQALMKARDLSEQSYKAGSITLTDVLDADRLLLVARDQLSAKQVDIARAAVGVFRALGGGWDS